MTARFYLLLLLLLFSVTAQAQHVETGRVNANIPIKVNTNKISTDKAKTDANGFRPMEIDSTETDTMPQGIDYDHAEETDSALIEYVRMFHSHAGLPKVLSVKPPTLEPSGLSFIDRQDAFNDQFYLSAGGLGHPHISLWFGGGKTSSFGWLTGFVTPAYGKTIADVDLYQTRRPYTALQYTSSLNKDHQVNITHTQNITPRWNFSFDYDLIRRDGEYTQSALKSHYLDATTNYYSRDSRYQLQAGFIRKNEYLQENGGIVDDQQFRDGTASTRSGIEVNRYGASNQWRTYDLFVHQTFNTVRQFDKLIPRHAMMPHDSIVARKDTSGTAAAIVYDTLHLQRYEQVGYDTVSPRKPHCLNSGVWGLNASLSKWRRNYIDMDSTGYAIAYADTSQTFDSTTAYDLTAQLYWTNDAYMDHRWLNPLKVTVGLRPQMRSVTMADRYTRWGNMAGYANATVSFNNERLSMGAERMMAGEYEYGDWKCVASVSHEAYHSRISIATEMDAQAPQWLFHHYLSNNYRWDTMGYKKIQTRRAYMDYHWTVGQTDSNHFTGSLRMGWSRIGNNVWFDETLHPYQTNLSADLLQATASAQLRLGWFHYDMQHFVQHSSNDAVVSVPLYACKNSIYADFAMFRKTLRMQTGFDLRYHTLFYADGYAPALGAFYHQRQTQVGNYLWADFFLTIKIRQACIYAKVSHFDAPFEQQPSYFLLPHYPGEDFGIYYGLVWKFFD